MQKDISNHQDNLRLERNLYIYSCMYVKLSPSHLRFNGFVCLYVGWLVGLSFPILIDLVCWLVGLLVGLPPPPFFYWFSGFVCLYVDHISSNMNPINNIISILWSWTSRKASSGTGAYCAPALVFSVITFLRNLT